MTCPQGKINVVDFLSDDEITKFFITINPNFCLSNLPSYIRQASAEWLALKTNTQWEQSNDILYVDGNETDCIAVPRVPIIELTDITIILKDETTRSLVLTGAEREIEYACDTGVIRLIKSITLDSGVNVLGVACDELLLDDIVIAPKFPLGLNNIRVTGVFGNKPLALLKLLQLLNMAKTLQVIDSETYSFGKVREKIGRYEYQLGSASKSTTIMSFDDYIQHLCDLLPDTECFHIGSI